MWKASLLSLIFALSLSSHAFANDQDAFLQSYRYEKAGNSADAIRTLLPARKKGHLYNVRLGWLHYLSGDYAKSKRYYQVAIQRAPRAVEPRLGLMLPLLVQKRYSEVESTARQVLMIDASNFYASLRLTVSLRMQGKVSQAKAVCSDMLELYPTDVSFLVEAGLNNVGMKNTPSANTAFRRALTLDPENVTAKHQLGIQAAAPSH